MPRECFPKIPELMKRNWPGAARIQFIKRNHGFYIGEKFKFPFWAEKFTNIALEYTKRCGIATFGGIFSKKN